MAIVPEVPVALGSPGLVAEAVVPAVSVFMCSSTKLLGESPARRQPVSVTVPALLLSACDIGAVEGVCGV